MKNQVLIFLLVFISSSSLAQKKEPDTAKVYLPLKDSQIFYEKIIDSLPGTKTELFNNSLKWMANSFNDSKEVIQLKDIESGTIIGAGNLRLYISGFIETNELISFMTEINLKDNKARLRLYQFRSKPIGYRYDFTSMEAAYQKYLSQIKFPKENRKYYQHFNDIILETMKSYEAFLKKNLKPDNF